MMKTTTILIAVAASVALTACGNNDIDPATAAVRQGPQVQSPIADAPGGKLPEGGASATSVIIIDG